MSENGTTTAPDVHATAGDGYEQFIADQQATEQDEPRQEEPKYQKQRSILDGLTEHRADRCAVLLQNLPNEDLVHIISKKLPAFLRIDNDVKRKRAELTEFHDQYMEYDIDLHMN